MSSEAHSRDPKEASQDSSGEERSINNGEVNAEGLNSGRWTDEEHSKFLEALQLFGKNWNKVHKHVGTRSSA